MIRSATKADYATFATLFRELAIDDPPPTYDRWTSALANETLVSECAGHVDGFVGFYALGDMGHVRSLVVAPDARNTGVGARLMRAAATLLVARGVGEWNLNVKCDNTPAIRLYENLGMRVEHQSTVLHLSWQARMATGERATALPVEPDEDDDIERALGLLGGQIAMARVRGDRVLVQLRDASCAPVGFAAFDPKLGAKPFRVARPDLAATLLDALRPHAIADRIQLVVEDDAALMERFVAAGAEVRLELLHYRGRLPLSPAAG